MTAIDARLVGTGRAVRVEWQGRRISAVTERSGRQPLALDDLWVEPGLWDLQCNGRWGVSFSDPTLTVGQVGAIVRAQAALGTTRVCPTQITAPTDSLRHGLRTIAAACDGDGEVAAMVAGVHLEGPFISDRDGARGAHPLASVRDPDWDEFRRLQDAAGGRIVLLTLAPERAGALPMIRQLVESGVTVAIGHTDADGPTIDAAVDAGATLSTHLGNGVAATLPRHPNAIWHQAAHDGLDASLIADGHHLDPMTLRALVRAKTPARVILVGDASPLAGLPPGRYGDWAVDPGGKIVVAGTPYLAGSNRSLIDGLNLLMTAAGLDLPTALATVTTNPARRLGRPAPRLDAGEPASFILFQIVSGSTAPIRLVRTCVDGRIIEAGGPDCPT